MSQNQTVNPEITINSLQKKNKKSRTAAYKLDMLKKVEEIKKEGGSVGAFLRQEGLYSSTLADWRKLVRQGVLGGEASPASHSGKAQAEIKELREALALEKERSRKLDEQVKVRDLVIDAQKKISSILNVIY